MNLFGLNRVVLYSIVLKIWQAGSGLLGLILISLYFPPEIQGYYYTFASLVSLQSFVELGLYIVINNFASHEWSKLNLAKDGSIMGDQQALLRLVSLGRFVFKWYSIAAIIFIIVIGAFGYWFLEKKQTVGIEWQIPWILHIIFSAVLMWCMPFLSLLEGCDQFYTVTKFRIFQALVSNTFFLIAIFSGALLWAAPILTSVGAFACIYYLLVDRRHFFKVFFINKNVNQLHWRNEIFPMQWRLAVLGVINYFIFSLFTPVMFHYHGAVIAGQMGMTLQLINAVQSIAIVWISVESPRFGSYVAKRQFSQLDITWKKATLYSVSFMGVGLLILQSVLYMMTVAKLEIVNRILPISSFVLLSAGGVFALLGHCLAVYLRAHLKEAFMQVGLLTGLLMGLMVWQLGAKYGSLGASASYFFVMACVSYPLAYVIWKKAKHEWH